MSIHYDLDMAAYHSGEGVSRSGLLDIERSPAIYYGRNIDPNRPPKGAPTPAMVLGTMTHCAVLEPGCFGDRYAVAPKVDRRTTVGKAEFAKAFDALKPGQEMADPDMMTQAQAMAASVLRIKPVQDLLSNGRAEVSAYWTDPETGVLCRIRPDWVSPAGKSGSVILDLKTTADASPKGFAKSVANWAYDFQAAMYCEGYAQASGQVVHGFVFAVVEKEYPYAAAAYMLDEETLDRANRRYRRALSTYAQCVKSGNWPGFTVDDEIQILEMPAWATKETE